MAVIYSTAVKSARLNAVTSAIGTAGKLEICTASYTTVLATIPLANPAAPSTSTDVLTFTMPQSDLSADAGGTAAIARIRTSANVDVVTGLTVGTASADIIMPTVTIAAGQQIDVSSATITHAS